MQHRPHGWPTRFAEALLFIINALQHRKMVSHAAALQNQYVSLADPIFVRSMARIGLHGRSQSQRQKAKIE